MSRACEAIGLPRATAYRHVQAPRERPPLEARRSHRALSPAEVTQLYAVLDSDRFLDQPPREVYAALLSEGRYVGSISTMYRYLRKRGPVRERRDHKARTQHPVPRLEATAPNQVWTWDITKLAGPRHGVFFNLYVILDLFSRFPVAWMVAERENTALAKQLFADAITRHGVEPGQLVVHMDRGAPMTAHGFTELLEALGVEPSHSRPRVSNDNPMSESHFHTMKYQPDFPGRFDNIGHARTWCGSYFGWYANDHHHDGLALYTPADVFYGRVAAVAAMRQSALDDAYREHPERFSKAPRVALPPSRVFINPPDLADSPVTADQVLALDAVELSRRLSPLPSPPSPAVVHCPGAIYT